MTTPKHDNALQSNVVQFFHDHPMFHYHGWTGTFWFHTWKKGEDKQFITLRKPNGDKDLFFVSVMVYSNRYPENNQYGVEMQIKATMAGDTEEESFFQGWVESIDELRIIMKAVGLN